MIQGYETRLTIGDRFAREYPDGRPTSATPRKYDGIEFRCFAIGGMRAEWRDPTGRCRIRANYNRTGFYLSVDGETIKATGKRGGHRRFASIANAAAAGLRLMAK